MRFGSLWEVGECRLTTSSWRDYSQFGDEDSEALGLT